MTDGCDLLIKSAFKLRRDIVRGSGWETGSLRASGCVSIRGLIDSRSDPGYFEALRIDLFDPLKSAPVADCARCKIDGSTAELESGPSTNSSVRPDDH